MWLFHSILSGRARMLSIEWCLKLAIGSGFFSHFKECLTPPLSLRLGLFSWGLTTENESTTSFEFICLHIEIVRNKLKVLMPYKSMWKDRISPFRPLIVRLNLQLVHTDLTVNYKYCNCKSPFGGKKSSFINCLKFSVIYN